MQLIACAGWQSTGYS